MLICQKVEINWSQAARGRKLAAIRNSFPQVALIPFQRQHFEHEKYIWGYTETGKYQDYESNKLSYLVSGLIFKIADTQLHINSLKFSNFEKKIAILDKTSRFKYLSSQKSTTYEFETIYTKSVFSLYFGDDNIPINYFQTTDFDFQISESDKIWL